MNETGEPSSAAAPRPNVPDGPLNATVLAQVASFNFRTRLVAEQATTGIHRSLRHGSSVEFAEHKEYAPGDNLRHLDWRAYARHDRDYIKQYEDEANIRTWLVLDRSASMRYPADATRLSKFAYGATSAAALAYILARQADAVGLAFLSSGLDVAAPPRARRGHLQEILLALSKASPDGESAWRPNIARLSDLVQKKSVVCIFSDLLDGGLAALPALSRLSARGNDVALFHTLDRDEIDFPYDDHLLLQGLEDRSEVAVDGATLASAYRAEAKAFIERAQAQCRAARVEYHLARTDRSAGHVIGEFLAMRAAPSRASR